MVILVVGESNERINRGNLNLNVSLAVLPIERLSMSGWVKKIVSSPCFFVVVSPDFIMMKILLLFRWRADVRRVV